MRQQRSHSKKAVDGNASSSIHACAVFLSAFSAFVLATILPVHSSSETTASWSLCVAAAVAAAAAATAAAAGGNDYTSLPGPLLANIHTKCAKPLILSQNTTGALAFAVFACACGPDEFRLFNKFQYFILPSQSV